MIGVCVIIGLATAVAVSLWRFGTRPSRVLKTLSVPVVPDGRPFVGHVLQILQAEHNGVYDYINMKKFGKIFGICEFSLPVLVVADPDLLKEILFKQFNSFMDRRDLPLRSWLKLSMFDQKGSEWRRIRAMLTPFFSSAKLKNNLPIMHHSVKNLLENLHHRYENGNNFEAHELASSLSLDVICSTAFGLKVDSQKNLNDPLLLTMKRLSNVSFSSPMIFLGFVFPFLCPILELFGINLFPSGYLEYFEKATQQMIEDRKKSHEVRADFIQSMVKAHLDELDHRQLHSKDEECSGDVKGEIKRGLTDKEIMAQVLLFFLAGYDTTARAISIFMYNMAVNPSIQEKVYQEILTKLGNEIPNYENIPKLEYLDMCVNESLRIYPPVFRFDREARNDLTIGGIKIPKKTIVVVPTWAIHHDPELWSSPDTFDPERFNAESKPDQNSFSFLPFGAGSRGCIGMRFAQFELKISVIEMLKSFKFMINSRTQVPLQLKNTFFLEPKDGLWLSVEPRK